MRKVDIFNAFYESAEHWGLIDDVVAPGTARECGIRTARALLAIPAAPLRMTKHAIGVAANALNHAVSYMDLEQYALCQSTDSHRAALDQFFEHTG